MLIEEKFTRRHTAHQLVVAQHLGIANRTLDMSRMEPHLANADSAQLDPNDFTALICMEAMSSDESDTYQDEFDSTRTIHGLKSSLYEWRTVDAHNYVRFLDLIQQRSSTMAHLQMRKPTRRGLKRSQCDLDPAQFLTSFSHLRCFARNFADGEFEYTSSGKDDPEVGLRMPPMVRLTKPASDPASVVSRGVNSGAPILISDADDEKGKRNMFALFSPPAKRARLDNPLTAHLLTRGLSIDRVPADGNCLYHSLLSQLRHVDPGHIHPDSGRFVSVTLLRMLFVEVATTNSETVKLFTQAGIDAHIENGHWNDAAGDSVLQLLLQRLRLHAVIVSSDMLTADYIVGSEAGTRRITLLRGVNHWDSLLPRSAPMAVEGEVEVGACDNTDTDTDTAHLHHGSEARID